MFNLFRFIFAFLNLCVVEEVSGGEPENQQEDTAGDVETEEPPADTAEQAWNALQEEGAGEPESEESVSTEENKTETPANEQEKEESKALTEEDLKPIENSNKKTQERFQKVTEGYKAEKSRADTLLGENERYKQSFDSLRQLGFTNEAAASDLIEFSRYRNVLANGDADKFAEAISAQVKQFEALHGKRVQVNGSIINDYDDLRQKVEDFEIDEETALEVARARSLQQRANREAERHAQAVKTEQQSQQLINGAVQEVVAMEQTWRNTDPDFNAVMPHLQATIADIKKLHPSQWALTIDMQYKAIKKALASAAPANRQTTALRGNSHMSANRQPQTLQEAVLQEFGFND